MPDSILPDLAGLLALSSDKLLLVDRSGRVLYANEAAKALLGDRAALALTGNMLSIRRKNEDKALRDAMSTLSPGEATTVCFRNREGVAILVVDLHLLASGLVAMHVCDIVSRSTPSLDRMRQVFGFTAAEARVAATMLEGAGITEAAHQRGVEPETVRSQVKRIRSKTGARSVAELLLKLSAIDSA